MLNRGLIRQNIEQGKIRQLRELMEKGALDGMQTFDQHLLDLLNRGIITEEVALAESESSANMSLHIQSKKGFKRGIEINLRESQGETNF
jgi:Tfp pilus assembly ATPase PilU